ncbi:MAG: hypothetical protein ACREQM_04950 [Candidatus Dormibacteraceae bacterium]
MNEQSSNIEMDDRLRGEVGGWAPRGAPNMHDVLRRADRGWQRPVVAYSGVAAFALALVLVVALVLLVVGSHFTLGDQIKEHLLAH